MMTKPNVRTIIKNIKNQFITIPRYRPTKMGKIVQAWQDQFHISPSFIRNCRKSNIIKLLGYDFDITAPDIWGYSPDIGNHWPRLYYRWYNPSDYIFGDYKLTWELGRLQFLPGILACEPQKGLQILRSYFAYDRLFRTIHWYSEMEIGIRTISFLICALLLESYKKDRNRLLQIIDLQYRFLCDHLTTWWPVTNNHLIVELSAVLAYEMLFKGPHPKHQNHWKLLEIEVKKQIYPDGGIREQSTNYVRFDLDAMLLLMVLCDLTGNSVPKFLQNAAERMMEFIMALQQPSGALPQIGDADDGRAIPPSCNRDLWDFRGHLAIGAVLYSRPDFKWAAGFFDNDLAYLLPKKAVDIFQSLSTIEPTQTTFKFPLSGYWIWKSSNGKDADYLLMRAGDFGLGGAGHAPHSHCDELSVILWMSGHPILVDCGTFTYDLSRDGLRNYFLGNSVHNILEIDERPQAEPRPGKNFYWNRVPTACFNTMLKNRAEATFLDWEDSFMWTRSAEVEKGCVRLYDRVSLRKPGVHKIKWFFNFHPDVKEVLIKDTISLRTRGMLIRITIDDLPAMAEKSIAKGKYSERYNESKDNFH